MSDNGIDWNKHAEDALGFSEIDRGKNNPFFQLKHTSGLVLDAGCSIGRWKNLLEDAGYEYVGVDQSKKALLLAKKLHPNANFVRAMIQNLPFQPAGFTSILSIAMLQHQNHTTKKLMLNQFKQVLKENGSLIMSEATYKDKSDDWTDDRGFNPNGWIRFITQEGFHFIEYLEPYYHFRRL